MENIQIINTKEMNDWVQIVFDYDEKTFFYFKENLGDNENICSETEIHYNNELVYSDKLVTIKKNQNETQKLEINKNIITKELFLELQGRKLIYNDFVYNNAYDLGFDFFDYYSKKHKSTPNADLETILKRKDSHKEELLFMIKQNNIYYFGNLKTETWEYIIKNLEITTCDDSKNKEFVLQMDLKYYQNGNVTGHCYYNDNLFVDEIKKQLKNKLKIVFNNKKIKKYILKLDSSHVDNLHLDLIYQNEKYLIRKIPKIPIGFDEYKYKIFDKDYNLLYEEFDPDDETKKYSLDGYKYPKEECNYKKKLYSNEFIYIFEKINFLESLGYSEIKTRINNDFNEYQELE